MATIASRSPLQPGEPAPDFTLPAVDRDGTVSLADYRGRSPLLLAVFRGLWCAYCRRAIAQMGVTRQKLQALGIETLGIVATKPENARLYFRFRPTRVPLAADPELITHRAYGIPKPPVTPELMQALQSVRGNPTGELPEPLPLVEASKALDRLHGFEPSETDRNAPQRQFPQLIGQFLIDRNGVVRWVNIECAKEGLPGLGKFPIDEELVAAARALTG
ncbi:MAG: redoxin domain-containing protein [candidate division NC10 bacterium]|nr:redoxin domain-containing protein [candidate division NC10 bacterium]